MKTKEEKLKEIEALETLLAQTIAMQNEITADIVKLHEEIKEEMKSGS